ncbi:MAG: transcription initiation factor IIB [Candidatus Bathyarchaeota archaeon]|nr:transcription initiation factor IIB [Candidatus Bathyarchaeota archaeon]
MLNTLEMAERQRLLQLGRCPECGSEERVTDGDSGEVVCRNCGLVLRELMLNRNPEWRAFTPEERKTKVRVGSPTSLRKFDKGLSTTFQPYRDARGKTLPMKERLKMRRLRKWQIRSRMHSSAQRNLSQAMTVLTRLSDQLRIPQDVVENAALIYRKALDAGLVRGRSIKSIAAAAIYAACRLTRTPRSLNSVVEASTRDRKEISRCYRLLQRELNITMPIDEPVKYISKIASRVGLEQMTQNLAIDLLQKAKKVNAVVGKGPAGIAAAALYIASIMNGEKVTQKELAKAAGVTEVTVRNRYKGLDESLRLGLRKILRAS